MFSEKYDLWVKNAVDDPELLSELADIKGDNNAVSDRFYKDLEFGTGGLRGEIGAGTNRMNIYTVGKATQGLAQYVLSVNEIGSVAIAYDSRIKSKLFAETAASVLAANGVKVYIYKELMPTPMLSYAVRYFKCDAGIVITASHNPSNYNGYKAYGPDGCQLNLEASNYVLSIMNSVDVFKGVKKMPYEDAVKEGLINYIDESVIEDYLNAVQSRSVIGNAADLSNLKVIYTPLHGTGNKPVREILKRIGVKNVTVVKEQELPDGNFPTAPYPNPEIREAFTLALKLSEDIKPDLLLATDPDCDRVGIAIPDGDGYRLFSGNEVGILLLDYIIKRRTAQNTMPEKPFAIKTIVSSELCRKIADKNGCELKDVLTGFKFIGEQIGILEKRGEEERFIFGFEESYGYLAGSYVRDKDAVVASMLICEMVAFYLSSGKTLTDVLEDLYREYGYSFCSQKSFYFEGESGMKKINAIMSGMRNNTPREYAGSPVVSVSDFESSVKTDLTNGSTEIIDLPKSNVIKFETADGCSLIVRPSGTEPKIKFYFNSSAETEDKCLKKLSALEEDCKKFL